MNRSLSGQIVYRKNIAGYISIKEVKELNFEFTAEQQSALEFYKGYAQEVVSPYFHELEETGATPKSLLEKMAKPEILGIPLPEEYGGYGKDFVTATICMEELSKASPATAGIINVSTEIVGYGILKFGTDEQKKKYVPKIASGEWIGAFALTEPGAGSDSAGVKTMAVLDGDEWVLNGAKCFITNSEISQLFLIAALTELPDGKKKISMFIVEKGTPGFTIGKHEDKLGIRSSSTCELVFDNCRLPKDALLGELGKGLKIALGGLDGGRVMIGAQGLGIAEQCFDECVEYLKNNRDTTGDAINRQHVQFKLAELGTKIEAAKLLLYKSAALWDAGQPFSKEAAMAKYLCSDLSNEVARVCMQYMGYAGVSLGNKVEQYLRDAKITEIYEGTNEIQLMVIAGHLGINAK